MKQKYYRVDRIKKVNAEYNILLGERSNGKSYAVKEDCLIEAWKGNMFVHLRRWQIDVKPTMVESYYADAPIKSITNNECNCITAYRGELFFSKMEDDGTSKRVKKAGRIMYLSGAEHFKSMSLPYYSNIIFEEFITDNGYLYDEPTQLFNIVSTVARRKRIRVWMIGNTISRLCPYFAEWELVNIPKQEQGTIDTYYHKTEQKDEETGETITIKIAVEYCENSGNNSKMFFGSSGMITGGMWESKPHPHLPKKYGCYNKQYALLIKYQSFIYKVEVLKDKETGYVILFVHPAKKNDNTKRIISKEFSDNPLITPYLTDYIKGDIIIKELLKRGKVCFSDNLTGSEFNQIIDEKGGL